MIHCLRAFQQPIGDDVLLVRLEPRKINFSLSGEMMQKGRGSRALNSYGRLALDLSSMAVGGKSPVHVCEEAREEQ